jgi:hypothetical protein
MWGCFIDYATTGSSAKPRQIDPSVAVLPMAVFSECVRCGGVDRGCVFLVYAGKVDPVKCTRSSIQPIIRLSIRGFGGFDPPGDSLIVCGLSNLTQVKPKQMTTLRKFCGKLL